MTIRRWVGALLAAFVVAFVPSTAWGTQEPTPTAEPSSTGEPAPEPSPSPSESPAPVETVTVTETANPEPAPVAPGVDSGVYVDPASGSVRMGEKSAVSLGVAAWLAALVAGLSTAWLVLP